MKKEIILGNGVVFKDATTYSRDDKEKIPTAYEADLGNNIRIYITNGHIHYKGEFIMHCHKLGIDTIQLKDVIDHESAANKAYAIAKYAAKKIYESFK